MNFKLINNNIPLFHGSRSDFDKFDSLYVGSGENAGPGIGMHFTDSLKGAAAHADRYVDSNCEPIVYVCRLKPGAIRLRRCTSIAEHESAVITKWEKNLPVSCLQLIGSRDWFDDLDKHISDILMDKSNRRKLDREKCRYLRDNGFDIIFNFEGGWQDNYLHGDVILILNFEVIQIIEKLKVNDIFLETIGDPKKYYLSETKALLGDTRVMSYLRRL